MTERGTSDGMEITSTALLSALAQGSTLENRGAGWWLAEKRIAYKHTKSVLVPDTLVEELIRSGAIRVEIPYTCARAILTDNVPRLTGGPQGRPLQPRDVGREVDR